MATQTQPTPGPQSPEFLTPIRDAAAIAEQNSATGVPLSAGAPVFELTSSPADLRAAERHFAAEPTADVETDDRNRFPRLKKVGVFIGGLAVVAAATYALSTMPTDKQHAEAVQKYLDSKATPTQTAPSHR